MKQGLMLFAYLLFWGVSSLFEVVLVMVAAVMIGNAQFLYGGVFGIAFICCATASFSLSQLWWNWMHKNGYEVVREPVIVWWAKKS